MITHFVKFCSMYPSPVHPCRGHVENQKESISHHLTPIILGRAHIVTYVPRSLRLRLRPRPNVRSCIADCDNTCRFLYMLAAQCCLVVPQLVAPARHGKATPNRSHKSVAHIRYNIGICTRIGLLLVVSTHCSNKTPLF